MNTAIGFSVGASNGRGAANAEAFWRLHQQPRNAWSFELDIRPYKESW